MDMDLLVKITKSDLKRDLIEPLRSAHLSIIENTFQEVFDGEFRIISIKDRKSPFSVDIIFTDQSFKKKPGSILGLPTYYQSPEGVILAKLRMIKATFPSGRSEKDREDIKAILKFTKLDIQSLKQQAKEENTIRLLNELLNDTS
jgi:hypothetical protein